MMKISPVYIIFMLRNLKIYFRRYVNNLVLLLTAILPLSITRQYINITVE